jgi:sulfite reductase (NADPH) hemoprotein beta-component
VSIRDWIEKEHLLSYTEAILRVYNELGRRDNIHKARIKILVKALGADEFRRLVDVEWDQIKNSELKVDAAEFAHIQSFFAPPAYDAGAASHSLTGASLSKDRDYARWTEHSLIPHKVPGYAIVPLSLKTANRPPGDVTDAQMDAIAQIADDFSFGRLIVTHRQNLVLSDVRIADLPALWEKLRAWDLATPNVNTITDIVACPGLDYCALANARSISVAKAITDRFADLERVYDLGDVTLNISGCINACGHHHVGNIGILGIDKQGVEHYQLMVGGSSADDAAFGKILGPAFKHDEIADAVSRLVAAYAELRTSPAERFLETYRRLGAEPFKEKVYAEAHPFAA